MKKDIDLTAYLPPFLARYKELEEILRAEEPELSLLWNKTEKTLCNQFITTANESGIANYERLLSLLPENSDSLEQRRARVMSKWLTKLPYTYKVLVERLSALCGGDFSLECSFDKYILKVLVHFRQYNDFLEVRKLLREMLPANIYYIVTNSVSIAVEGSAKIYSYVGLSRKLKRISVNVKR